MLLDPQFFAEQFLNSLQFSMLLFLLAIGLSVVFGLMDYLNLSHGTIYMFAASVAFSITQLGGSFWPGPALAPDRNRSVLAKEYFNLPVNFSGGRDRVYVTEKMAQIVIPRAKDTTSGANFEVLVGFDVTPQMAAFNRDGKRFRVNAGTGAVAAAGTTERQ